MYVYVILLRIYTHCTYICSQALDALDKSDIAEIRVFSKPPELVGTVMEAICILFNTRPDWASAKTLLADTGLMKKMIEYDKVSILVCQLAPSISSILPHLALQCCVPPSPSLHLFSPLFFYCSIPSSLPPSLQDNISDATIKKLKKYIENPKFVPDIVEKTSKACKSMCLWVRALDKYGKVFRTVEPKRAK